ncbi:MAG: HepT-like ribonuclease domain-containing protein [Ruminiclostridium sp.]
MIYLIIRQTINRCVKRIIDEYSADSNNLKDYTKLKSMVGFRNIAVHDYKSANISIVKEVIEKHLVDFIAFANIIIKIDNI